MKKNMKLEEILARNITRLMAGNPALDTIDKLSQRSGVGRGTVDRVKKAEVSTKIETVQALAAAFGVTPLQLLAGDEDAAAEAAGQRAQGYRTPTSMQWVSTEENQLLSLYRTTDDEGRRTIMNIASIVPKVLGATLANNKA